MLEDNIRDFNINWTGTGAIENAGVADTERLALEASEYMESEVWQTGVITTEVAINVYSAGDAVTIQYRTNSTNDMTGISYIDYTVPFKSDGYVQVRLTSTL